MSDQSAKYEITDSCPCGSRFKVAGDYWRYLSREHTRWLNAHAGCREDSREMELPNDG